MSKIIIIVVALVLILHGLIHLTALDWRVAYAGVVVNLVILVALTLEPRLVSWFAG